MAQGFKAKLPAKKAKSSAVVQKQKAITKKGSKSRLSGLPAVALCADAKWPPAARKVAPKDPVLISQQTKTVRRLLKSHTRAPSLSLLQPR